MKQLLAEYKLISVGIGLAILYWITESYLDLFDAEHEGATYIERLLSSGDTNELRMRIITIGLLIGFSVYAQTLMNRHRKAEDTQARLASIVENAVDAIDSKTLDGTIVGLNPSAERLYGYPEEELKGKNISVLTPPELMDEMKEILDRVGHGEVVSEHETVRVSKDGRRIPLSLTVSPVRDSAGNIVGISAIARDITERKRAEERLRASVNRSRSSGRSALPAVASPAFSDEPPDDDDHVREGHPEIDDLPTPLGTPEELFVGVAPRIRPLHDPPHPGLERGGLALLGDHADRAAALQDLPGDLRVVGTVEVDAGVLRQPPKASSRVSRSEEHTSELQSR